MAIKLGFRKSTQTGELSHIRRIKSLLSMPIFFLCLIAGNGATAQSIDSLTRRDITFSSEGVLLSVTLISPTDSQVAIVLVHGSGQEKRMTGFAERMAAYGITVLTYDKFNFGLVAAFGITQGVLLKNNLLFGYKVNDNVNTSLII